MKDTNPHSRAAALLAAVPVALLGASSANAIVAIGGDIPITPQSFTNAQLANGVQVDIDGDGVTDFSLGLDNFDGYGTYGDALVLYPRNLGDGIPETNFALVDVEADTLGPLSASGDPAAAFTDNATLDAVVADLFNNDGTPTGILSQGRYASDSFISVLYEPLAYEALLAPGTFTAVVFDIPGGSPYVASLDFDINANFDNNTGTFVVDDVTLAAGSSYIALPEPTAAALALSGLALLARRRRA